MNLIDNTSYLVDLKEKFINSSAIEHDGQLFKIPEESELLIRENGEIKVRLKIRKNGINQDIVFFSREQIDNLKFIPKTLNFIPSVNP